MSLQPRGICSTPNPQFAKAFDFLSHDIAIEPGVVGYDECRSKIGGMLNAVAAGEDPAKQLAATVAYCDSRLATSAPGAPASKALP